MILLRILSLYLHDLLIIVALSILLPFLLFIIVIIVLSIFLTLFIFHFIVLLLLLVLLIFFGSCLPSLGSLRYNLYIGLLLTKLRIFIFPFLETLSF